MATSKIKQPRRVVLSQRSKYSSKPIVLGGHRNRKTGAKKSLSSDLKFNQSRRSNEPKSEKSPFASAFLRISRKRQTIDEILLAPPPPTRPFCIQRAYYKSISFTRLSRNRPIRALENVFANNLRTVRRSSIPSEVLAPLGPPVRNSPDSENVLTSQLRTALCK